MHNSRQPHSRPGAPAQLRHQLVLAIEVVTYVRGVEVLGVVVANLLLLERSRRRLERRQLAKAGVAELSVQSLVANNSSAESRGDDGEPHLGRREGLSRCIFVRLGEAKW